jgi:hypothetical protein
MNSYVPSFSELEAWKNNPQKSIPAGRVDAKGQELEANRVILEFDGNPKNESFDGKPETSISSGFLHGTRQGKKP